METDMKCPSCGEDIQPRSYWLEEIDGVPRIKRYLLYVVLFVAEGAVMSMKDPGTQLTEALGAALAVFIFAYYFSLIAKRHNRWKALCWLSGVFFILAYLGKYGAPGTR